MQEMDSAVQTRAEDVLSQMEPIKEIQHNGSAYNGVQKLITTTICDKKGKSQKFTLNLLTAFHYNCNFVLAVIRIIYA